MYLYMWIGVRPGATGAQLPLEVSAIKSRCPQPGALCGDHTPAYPRQDFPSRCTWYSVIASALETYVRYQSGPMGIVSLTRSTILLVAARRRRYVRFFSPLYRFDASALSSRSHRRDGGKSRFWTLQLSNVRFRSSHVVHPYLIRYWYRAFSLIVMILLAAPVGL